MEKYLPKIKRVPLIEKVKIGSSFEEIFAHFKDQINSSLLNSSLETDAGRYSFIGIEPFITLSSRGNNVKIKTGDHRLTLKANPFDSLGSIISSYKTENPLPLPFTAGGVGYFSYDLKDVLERLPKRAKDDLKLPEVCFIFYRALIISDRENPGEVYISVADTDSCGHEKAPDLLKRIKKIINSPIIKTQSPPKAHKSTLESNFTKPGYIKAVRKVMDYIRSGDIYQVCLSQRFKTEWPHDAYELYLKLNKINPSPFSAYLNFEEARIVSSSPELFLRLRGDTVQTRPMKGTRPRGSDQEKDKALKGELVSSSKDAAELSMIVDLERNDLGKVSLPGSIKVTEHRRTETYPTVFQTISIVEGKLESGINPVEVIKAAFPGGSISGCPKIRAMEIIDELEPTKRSVYTGSIGYISFHGTMDLNIAIRTMIMKGKDVYFQSGGGITADSIPEAEYAETLDKARALMQSLTC